MDLFPLLMHSFPRLSTIQSGGSEAYRKKDQTSGTTSEAWGRSSLIGNSFSRSSELKHCRHRRLFNLGELCNSAISIFEWEEEVLLKRFGIVRVSGGALVIAS